MNRQIFCTILPNTIALVCAVKRCQATRNQRQTRGLLLNGLLLSSLLFTSQTIQAEKLYRWIEPDGSITFSPVPPASGVEYKTVQSSGSNVTRTPQKAAIEESAPSILATSEHDSQLTLPPVNETPIAAQPALAVAKPRISYAPDTGEGITRSTEPAVIAPTPEANTTKNTRTIASDNKRRQCQDLSKRVMSLEQRLRSKLLPEDMDNTVIAMARYQRSYDQHCIN